MNGCMGPDKIRAGKTRQFITVRQVVGIHWLRRISSNAFAADARTPISTLIRRARWGLFAHALRLPPDNPDNPAQRSIDRYFADAAAAAFRGRPRSRTTVAELAADAKRDIQRLRSL